jgi:hypothetical protein
MQTRKPWLVIAIAACGVTFTSGSASAADKYNVTFDRPAVIGGVELKPGEYRLTLDGEKATFSAGKQSAEAGVAVRTDERKYSATTVRYDVGDGKNNVVQIRLRGTNRTIELQEAVAGGGSSGSRRSGGGASKSANK